MVWAHYALLELIRERVLVLTIVVSCGIFCARTHALKVHKLEPPNSAGKAITAL
jgi:hypothetical protein